MVANAGYKAYATGDVLTAAQVQYNLQNQTVMYFATSAARTTALSGVTVEGMVTYIPANGLEYYNGSAWITLSTGGDITGVAAGKGLSGGGTTGDVTVSLATTAKGDLVAGTGASTAAALTVGTDGTTLVADSSTSTGLRYTAGTVQANPVLNSAMQIWQRGTSFATTAATYTADRWYAALASAGTVSRQVTNDTTNLPFIQYCARFARTASSSSTTALELSQSLETVNSIPFAGKTVTYSFYARAGANYSPTSGNLQVLLKTGTGTDQNVSTGYTGSTSAINSNVVLTTTWQRFSVTASLASTTTEIGLMLSASVTGTAGASDYFEVTGVQLDIGNIALPFRTYAGTVQGELAACQRYLPVIGGQYDSLLGFAYSTTGCQFTIPFQVVPRVTPTGISLVGTVSDWRVGNTGFSAGAPTAITWNAGGTHSATINTTTTVGTPTIANTNPVYLQAQTTTGLILFTGCEL